MSPALPQPKHDLLTVIAIGLIVNAVVTFVHEGLGHGGVCLLVGGKLRFLSSMNFDGDPGSPNILARKAIAAGGTILNLLAGALALLTLPRVSKSAHGFYFFWLFAAVNLFAGTGYFMYSGASNIGDWAVVVAGLPGVTFWRIFMFVGGTAAYFGCVWLMMKKLGPLAAGESPQPYRRASLLCLTPYLAGAVLSLVAGLFQPDGKTLLLISALAASVGGTSGLAWGPQFLRDRDMAQVSDPPLTVQRNWAWILVGIAIALLFVFVLGPGIKF